MKLNCTFIAAAPAVSMTQWCYGQPDFAMRVKNIVLTPIQLPFGGPRRQLMPRIHGTMDSLICFGTRGSLSSMEADLPPGAESAASGSKAPVPGDVLEFVDFNHVAKVERRNAVAVASLAFEPANRRR